FGEHGLSHLSCAKNSCSTEPCLRRNKQLRGTRHSQKCDTMRVSIMITTRNRVGELRRTIQMLGKLDPSPDEILITADGCTDGTTEFVRSALPNAKLIVNQTAIGSVAARDRMMREATGDLVLALDDDSYPEQPHCIAKIVTSFQQRPE